MQQKKIPMRQCLGCREMKPKKDLMRIVRTPDGSISLDFKGKVSGRGAYICKNAACFNKAVKTKAVERSLEIQIPAELLARMSEEIAAANEE